MTEQNMLNVNQTIGALRTLGPGIRAALWLQGCVRNCPGCINPDTHKIEINRLISVDELLKWTFNQARIEGITISGGEPLLQADSLAIYLKNISHKGLSIILYTGYTYEEICNSGSEAQRSILNYVDLLIDGPFERNYILPFGLRGSCNQRFIFLSQRYKLEDIEAYERQYLTDSMREIMINSNGIGAIIGFRFNIADQHLISFLSNIKKCHL
jgi:anaerobic ribonucleoside-triphosphate reductase activating protein